MGDDVMSLYSQRILALAADIPLAGHLEAPQGHASRRAPQCGSSVGVDLDLTDGRISRFAQNVRACALGQASAGLLGAQVLGADRAIIAAGRDAMRALLAEGAEPAAPWQALAVLRPAKEFHNRHASILLVWEATLAAMDAAADAARHTRCG